LVTAVLAGETPEGWSLDDDTEIVVERFRLVTAARSR